MDVVDSTEEGEIQDEPSLDELSSLSSVELPQTSINGSTREKENCQENSHAKKRPSRHNDSNASNLNRKACCRKRKAARRSLTPSSDSDGKSPNRGSAKSMRRHEEVPLPLKHRRSRKPSRRSDRTRYLTDKSTALDKKKQLILSATVGNSLKERLQAMLNKSASSSETKTSVNDDDDEIQILVVPKPSPILLDITGDTVVCLTKESQENTELEDEDYLRLQALQSAVIKNKAWGERKPSKIETAEVCEPDNHYSILSDFSSSEGQVIILPEVIDLVQGPEEFVENCVLNVSENQIHSGAEVEETDSVEEMNNFHIPATVAKETISENHNVANIVEVALVADTSAPSEKLSERHIAQQHHARSSAPLAKSRINSRMANSSSTSEMLSGLVEKDPCFSDFVDSFSDSDSRDLSSMIVIDEIRCSPEPPPSKHTSHKQQNINDDSTGPNVRYDDEIATKNLYPVLDNLDCTSAFSPSRPAIMTTAPAVSTINEHNSNNLSNLQTDLPICMVGTENVLPPYVASNIKTSGRPKTIKNVSVVRHSSTVKNVPTTAKNVSASRNHCGSSKTGYGSTTYAPSHFDTSPTASTWTKWTSNKSSKPDPAVKPVSQRKQFAVNAEQNKRFVIHVNESSESEEEEQFPSLTRTIVNDLAPPVVKRPQQDPNFAEKLDALLKESRELQAQKAKKEKTATSTSTSNNMTKKRKSSQESMVKDLNPKGVKVHPISTGSSTPAEKQEHLRKEMTNSSQIGNTDAMETHRKTVIQMNTEIGFELDYNTREMRNYEIPHPQINELQKTEALLRTHRQTLSDKLTGLLALINDDVYAKDYLAQQKLIIAQAQNVILQSRENIMEAKKRNEELHKEMNVNRVSAVEFRDRCRMDEALCYRLGSQLDKDYRLPSELMFEIRDKLTEVGAGFARIRLEKNTCKKSAKQNDAPTADCTVYNTPAKLTNVAVQGNFVNGATNPTVVKSQAAFKSLVSAVSASEKSSNMATKSSAFTIKPHLLCATTVNASTVPVTVPDKARKPVAKPSTVSTLQIPLIASAVTVTSSATATSIAKPAKAVSTHAKSVSTHGTAASVPGNAGNSTWVRPLVDQKYTAHTTSFPLSKANNAAVATWSKSAFARAGSSHTTPGASHANIVATAGTELSTSAAVLATTRYGRGTKSNRPALAIFSAIEK